jgi:hypothetical protein
VSSCRLERVNVLEYCAVDSATQYHRREPDVGRRVHQSPLTTREAHDLDHDDREPQSG